MDTRHERWVATGTTALVVAVAAATWATTENALAWRDTFRLEDLAYARGDHADFEAYRPGWIGESTTAWSAMGVLTVAVVVTVVAGVRARRWPPLRATVGALGSVTVVASSGVLFPWVHVALPLVVVGATLALRALARPAPPSSAGGAASRPVNGPPS
ncbi:hypothetical protein [Puerhibacterium sp. TATVAM-FAB25]|uniref:hypothetical protein n=1 Tax=Puerhibacterium sp. TATVAM-FAB25 TaxID=3093699 RepID=UPI00397BB23E